MGMATKNARITKTPTTANHLIWARSIPPSADSARGARRSRLRGPRCRWGGHRGEQREEQAAQSANRQRVLDTRGIGAGRERDQQGRDGGE